MSRRNFAALVPFPGKLDRIRRGIRTGNIDQHVLDVLRSTSAPSLHYLLRKYTANAGAVVDATLPYAASQSLARVDFASSDSGVVLVAHVVERGGEHQVTLCSGFAIQPVNTDPSSRTIISCAHTLEQVQHSPLLNSSPLSNSRSATFVFYRDRSTLRVTARPATDILACLPRSDLVLLDINTPSLSALPISPYPAPAGTRIRAHFVSETKPTESGWTPWIHGTWSKWVQGKIHGYRDTAGREAEPGSYDTLSHLLFNPPPLPGSSGGPIVDEESHAVIGVVLGSRMDNPVEGVRGWGVPSELIYEMFRLPGLDTNSH